MRNRFQVRVRCGKPWSQSRQGGAYFTLFAAVLASPRAAVTRATRASRGAPTHHTQEETREADLRSTDQARKAFLAGRILRLPKNPRDRALWRWTSLWNRSHIPITEPRARGSRLAWVELHDERDDIITLEV